MNYDYNTLCYFEEMPGPFPKFVRKVFGVVLSGWLTTVIGVATFAQGTPNGGGAGTSTSVIKVKELQGVVEILNPGTTQWMPAQAGQILSPTCHLRTGVNGRAALLWSDQSVVPVGPSTEIEILSPQSQQQQCGLHLVRGIISFFHRDKPGQIQVITRGAMAGVEGTEFVLAVNDADQTTLSVIDGKVSLANPQGSLLLTNGQQAVVDIGKAPARAAGFIANNLLQWSFYYPAVLDINDLPLTAQEAQTLGASLAAYRQGDLQAALAQFPPVNANSDAVRLYHAALLLSVGEAAGAQDALASLNSGDERIQRLAGALRELIAAVKREPSPGAFEPKLASEFLARSYYEQSHAVPGVSLEQALALARRATEMDPQFGFAWARVTELEFSFGRTARALDALDTSLSLAPRNAQALALRGFLLAAQNRAAIAIIWFDQALAVDPSLGNAWLGRGLCRIRIRDFAGGREDLLVAAAIEPQRAVLRSYLGKAYANSYEFGRAAAEFKRAKQLDPNDPTAWLYSALMNQERNRINDAIRDLEKSQELNDNRSVYRSQMLLDQDKAVRSASLATMYQDAGMFDVSVNEASRAVSYDYGNYSAHLFLADSYQQLSDPNEINLRYETPAESEYLVANLLAPVGGGILSPTISQGEYSRLFQEDGPGLISDTEYLSRGAWTQSGAVIGTYQDFSFDVEGDYRFDPGQWANNDVEQRNLSATVKQQLTPQDMVYFNVQQYKAEYGDLLQYYRPQTQVNQTVQYQEKQNPNISVGYNHEWAPGVNTLFFGARLNDTASFTNGMAPTLLGFYPPPSQTLSQLYGLTMNQDFLNRINLYSGELQQIFEGPAHTTIIGTRLQYGSYETSNFQDSPSILAFVFGSPADQQYIDSTFKSFSGYAYHQWQILDPLQIIAGIDYNYLSFPELFGTAPVSEVEKDEQQFSPKAGLVFTPWDGGTARFAYTRSLAGASIDQSYQIEPSQVAGFIQNYRSIIPESIVGPTPGARFSTYDLSLEQKFHTGTYLTLSGEILQSKDDQMNGLFAYFPAAGPPAGPSTITENLNYQEETLQFTLNQLIARDWSLGLKDRVSHAVLNQNFSDVPDSVLNSSLGFEPQTKGTLNELDLTAIYNHPSGFFVEGEGLWFDQDNSGYTQAEPGDDFWQFNAFVGYRSPGRNLQASIGVLNITNRGYNLNPLNIYNELPLTRTLVARLQINF
ncbi:MAG TPA: TonB-dependent receptor [Candidatus Sulfotelmatobacter sp.]|nr:TonB-dependent receptor [Candidatus Sulfotelmatobacter sp.]